MAGAMKIEAMVSVGGVVRCRHCDGPIVQGAGGLWLHDNSGGWYAGREMRCNAEPKGMTASKLTEAQVRALAAAAAGSLVIVGGIPYPGIEEGAAREALFEIERLLAFIEDGLKAKKP